MDHLRSACDLGAILDPDRFLIALVDVALVLLGFAVGYYGFPGLMPAHGAAIPSAIVLLAARPTVSAITTNMGRLRGAVLGAFIGQHLFSVWFLGWWGEPGVLVVPFTVVLLCVLLCFSPTSTWTTTGYVMIAFSVLRLPQGCLDGPGSCRPPVLGGDAASVVVALGLVALADLLRRRGSASYEASEALLGATAEVRAALRHLLDPARPERRHRTGAVQDAIDSAALLSREAVQAPRCFGAPLRADLFLSGCAGVRLIAREVSLAETSTADAERAGSPKSQALLTLLRMPAFRRIPQMILDGLDVLAGSLPVLGRVGPDVGDRPAEPPEGLTSFDEEVQLQVRTLLQEVSRSGAFKGNLSATTMAQDPAAQLSVVLCSVMAISTEISRLRSAIEKDTAVTASPRAPMLSYYKRKADRSTTRVPT